MPRSLGASTGLPDSPSLADLVDDVAGWPLNDSLNATLVADVGEPFTVPVGPTVSRQHRHGHPADRRARGTTWFVQGNMSKATPVMRLRPQTLFVAKRHKVKLTGTITAECESASAEALLAQVKAGLGAAWIPQILCRGGEVGRCAAPDFFDIPYKIFLVEPANA